MSAIDHVHYRACASRSMDDLFRGPCDCGLTTNATTRSAPSVVREETTLLRRKGMGEPRLTEAAERLLREAIEDVLATPRPQAGPTSSVAEIKAYELAHQRLLTAYRAALGEVQMCAVSSSVTGQPCLLAAGHPQDSATRFHRYAALPAPAPAAALSRPVEQEEAER